MVSHYQPSPRAQTGKKKASRWKEIAGMCKFISHTQDQLFSHSTWYELVLSGALIRRGQIQSWIGGEAELGEQIPVPCGGEQLQP